MADDKTIRVSRPKKSKGKYSRESLAKALTEGNLHDGTIRLPSSFDINQAVAELSQVDDNPPPPFSDVDKFMTLNNINFDYNAMAAKVEQEKHTPPPADVQKRKPLPSIPPPSAPNKIQIREQQKKKPLPEIKHNRNPNANGHVKQTKESIEQLLPTSFSNLPGKPYEQSQFPDYNSPNPNELQNKAHKPINPNKFNSANKNLAACLNQPNPQQHKPRSNSITSTNINNDNPSNYSSFQHQQNGDNYIQRDPNVMFKQEKIHQAQNLNQIQNVNQNYQPAYLSGFSAPLINQYSSQPSINYPTNPQIQNQVQIKTDYNSNGKQFNPNQQPTINLYANQVNPQMTTGGSTRRNPLLNSNNSYLETKNSIENNNIQTQMNTQNNSNVPPDWQPNKTPDGRLYYLDHSQRKTHWPPPQGWAIRKTNDGRLYYVHHPTKTTHWRMPPAGWDVCKTPDGRIFYADHINKKTSWTLPEF